MNRLWLALKAFGRCLTQPDFASRVEPLFEPQTTGPDLRVLAVLQRDGRLIDFLEEDIDPYADAQIGAHVRVIHRDCRKSLREYLTLEPVMSEAEEDRVTIAADFDPAAVRLVGNVHGSPPFHGVLKHRGWRVKAARLPNVPATRDGTAVMAPAEVEVS